MNEVKLRYSKKIFFVIVSFVLFFFIFTFFSGCRTQSKELKEILNNPAANMHINSAIVVGRVYNDNSYTFGKPIYAELRINYEPKKEYSKEDVFNEIIKYLNETGWEKNWSKYSDNKMSGYFTASLPYESFSLFVEVLYDRNANIVNVLLGYRTNTKQQ